MGDEVRSHPLGRTTGKRVLKSALGEPSAFNCAEGNDYRCLMPVRTRLRERDDLFCAGCVLYSNASGPHPVVTLCFGDDVEHMALRNDHQTFPRVGFGPDSASFS